MRLSTPALAAIALAVLRSAAIAGAQTATFTFESNAADTPLPATSTVNGLTATLTGAPRSACPTAGSRG